MNKAQDNQSSPNQHPSYGIISLARFTSSHGFSLFGSSVKHMSAVRITLSKAKTERKTGTDFYWATETIAEVDVSEAQLGKLFSSANVGDGTPCTIHFVDGKCCPPCPEKNERKAIEEDISLRFKKMATHLDGLITALRGHLERRAIGKSGLRDLLSEASLARQEIASNMPFLMSELNEAMDNIVNEAKADVDGYTRQRLEQLGLHADQQRLQQPITGAKFLEGGPTK